MLLGIFGGCTKTDSKEQVTEPMPNSQVITAEEQVRLESEQKAVDKADVSICDEIEDKNEKYTCKYNVLADKALKENNPLICDQIGHEAFIKNCKNNF